MSGWVVMRRRRSSKVVSRHSRCLRNRGGQLLERLLFVRRVRRAGALAPAALVLAPAAVVAVVLIAITTLSAQAPQGGGGPGGRGAAAGQTVEKIRELKPNLYVITGGGANTLVRVTTEGLIVVDTKNPSDENYKRLMEEIASVSKQPVKYVLNTHHHPDHV